jgi:hypothetical protein
MQEILLDNEGDKGPKYSQLDVVTQARYVKFFVNTDEAGYPARSCVLYPESLVKLLEAILQCPDVEELLRKQYERGER